jgi:hypothetical protein
VHSTVLLLIALVAGCGDDAVGEPPEPTGTAECEDPFATRLPDGTCLRPGITPDSCAPGFEHDGSYGCLPVLPPDICPAGQMAVPGDAACRPVMECAPGTWGDIPVDATTEYVDASYAGGDSSGSQAQPWTTIGEAVAAAAPGAVVAVAAGLYVEPVFVGGKAVRLMGVCPDQVTIEGSALPANGCPPAALCIAPDAHGTEIRGVSLIGGGAGVVMTGSVDVLIDRVWIHDVGSQGINAQNTLGPTSLTVQGSLIEQARDVGINFTGCEGTVDGSVVRATRPGVTGDAGRGIELSVPCEGSATDPICDAASRAIATIRGSVSELNHDSGIAVTGSDGFIEGTVVRLTIPDDALVGGNGISLRPVCGGTGADYSCDPATRATATVLGSYVQQNVGAGIFVSASDATIDTTVVRDTLPSPDQSGGRGLIAQLACSQGDAGPACLPAMRSNVSVVGSLLLFNRDAGMFTSGADVVVERSVIAATQPHAGTLKAGRGFSMTYPCLDSLTGNLVCDTAVTSNATIRTTLIDGSHDMDLFAAGGQVNVEASAVRNTVARAADGFYGDGVAVFGADAATLVTLSNVRIDESARAGFANFSATTSLGGTRIGCASFALAGERHQGQDYSFEDRGDNLCGCPTASDVCKVVSAGLQPPEP